MKYNRSIDNRTQRIAFDFIIDCPSSVKKGGKYYPVSARGCSFRQRGIQNSLLRTLLSYVKKSLPSKECYLSINASSSVEDALVHMKTTCTLTDPQYEYIVICVHSAMTETEAVFYYIRNSFAHGSFFVDEIKSNERLYYLESKKEDKLKASMCLKETTLETYYELMNLPQKKIDSMQKKRKIPAFQ